jgi:hypothetical protein
MKNINPVHLTEDDLHSVKKELQHYDIYIFLRKIHIDIFVYCFALLKFFEGFNQ